MNTISFVFLSQDNELENSFGHYIDAQYFSMYVNSKIRQLQKTEQVAIENQLFFQGVFFFVFLLGLYGLPSAFWLVFKAKAKKEVSRVINEEVALQLNQYEVNQKLADLMSEENQKRIHEVVIQAKKEIQSSNSVKSQSSGNWKLFCVFGGLAILLGGYLVGSRRSTSKLTKVLTQLREIHGLLDGVQQQNQLQNQLNLRENTRFAELESAVDQLNGELPDLLKRTCAVFLALSRHLGLRRNSAEFGQFVNMYYRQLRESGLNPTQVEILNVFGLYFNQIE